MQYIYIVCFDDYCLAERFGLRPSKVEKSTRPKDTRLTVEKGRVKTKILSYPSLSY